MDHFAGLDVSVKETSVCIVDDTGKIVREVKVASEPEALLAVLKNPAYHFKRIGLEAGPLSQWLFSALAEAELPVVCVETRHMRAVLKAQINKTDRNDARGIAQMMRVGLYRPVHVKTLRNQKLRMLLTHRKLLQSKAIAIENDLRGTLRNFGLKVGKTRFEARIKELVENLPDLAELVEPMLIVRRTLREQIVILHRRLLAIVRDDAVCRRLMTIPGVGPVVPLTYGVGESTVSRTRTLRRSSADVRFHRGTRPCLGGRRKRGQHDQALGRSRGGFSTKIHLKTDFGGLPIAFHLTGGEASDSRNFETLLDIGPDINPRAALGDKGYDFKSNREAARQRGICPAIPYRSNTKDIPTFFPKTLYKARARIEQAVGKLKRFKRIALRCEKTAQNYGSFVALALGFILIKSVHTA